MGFQVTDQFFNLMAYLFSDGPTFGLILVCLLAFVYAALRYRSALALILIPITLSLTSFYLYVALEPGTGALSARELTAWFRPSFSIFVVAVAVWCNRKFFLGRDK